MHDEDEVTPGLPTARWLALGGAGGAALVLALGEFGLSGPWPSVALVLVLLTTFAIAAFLFAARRHDHALRRAAQRARRGEEEIGQLQREIDRHTQLETQLRLAKQEAESAVMAKGEFLATMSHEIRTPLNGIVPMLDLLLNASTLAPDHRELVRTAYASSQQLLRIVDDILDYSKLEADRLELESTVFNLRELVETVIQLMERPAEAKGLRLHLQIDPAVRLPVRGDPVRLRQVIGNLLSNAVKFTERGAVTVTVRRIGETPAQHQLRFEVRDTGIGIPEGAQARLFHAFSQADASTTRLYGGTGLGLAICRRIVDLMGGDIGVLSEPGRGATFWFEVPLLKVAGDMPAHELNLSGGRLLLLTADARLRLRLSALLPNWGLRVTPVETTQEALDRLRAAAAQGEPWAYSMVLADLNGIRSTALALSRNLERHAIYGDVRLFCLQGDDPVPEELRRSATVLPRQVPDPELRVALTAPVAVAAPPTEDVEDDAPTGQMPHVRVLLVEDNPVNLMVGQRLLGVLGAECDTANNGEVALMRMSAGRYDLVLMDCQMPVMDGYTATRRWREDELAAGGGQHLPIIAMTANAMAGDRQKCLDAGMDDYLAKPVTRGELERCLRRWRRPRAGEGNAPRPVQTAAAEAHGAAPAAASNPSPATAPATAATAAGSTPSAPSLPTMPVTPAVSAPSSRAVFPLPPIETPPAPPGSPAQVAAMPAAPAPRVPPTATTPTPVQASRADSTADAVARAALQAGTAGMVLDHAVLDELRTVLGAEIDRLVSVFLEEVPQQIIKLEAAALGPDFTVLHDVAHSLKSASANVGAMALSTAAKRVELGARMRTLDRPAVAVALVAREFDRARFALRCAVRKASIGV